jgi:hypothetical protein
MSHKIFSYCKHGNQGIYFTVGQKRHKGTDITMETGACDLLYSKSSLRAFLASGIKDRYKENY